MLPLSQGMIATLAGVTRQTANKFFDAAEAKGVIRRDARGRITVVDRAAPAGPRRLPLTPGVLVSLI